MRINQALTHWSLSKSPALGLCSGFTCSIRLITLLALSLTAPYYRYRTLPLLISLYSSSSFPARKGKMPTSSRQRMTPKAHTSALAPLYGIFLTSSGHIQAGVPQKLFKGMRELALKPKSISFMCPYQLMRMFYGLRSRWQTPFLWQQSIPQRISLKYLRAFGQVKVFSFLSSPARLCLPAFSMIKKSFLRYLTKSTNLTTLGLSSNRRCLISLLIYANLFQSNPYIFSQVFMANDFSWPTAKETTEKAPFPICDNTFRSFMASQLDRNSSKYAALSPRSLLLAGLVVFLRSYSGGCWRLTETALAFLG